MVKRGRLMTSSPSSPSAVQSLQDLQKNLLLIFLSTIFPLYRHSPTHPLLSFVTLVNQVPALCKTICLKAQESSQPQRLEATVNKKYNYKILSDVSNKFIHLVIKQPHLQLQQTDQLNLEQRGKGQKNCYRIAAER